MADTNLDFDFDKFVAEEVQKAVDAKLAAQPNAAAPPVAPTPQPITVDLDGVKYQFASEAELNTALATWRAQTQAELSRVAQPAPQTPQGVTGDDKPKWDMERFVSLMTENPVEAFDYVDNFRYFDGKEQKASKVIRERLERAEMMEKTLAAEQFRQLHPEFPITDPNATAVVDRVRTQLGLPFTVQGLEAAYYTAVNTNPQFRQHLQQTAPQSAPSPQSSGYPAPHSNQPVPINSHPYASPPQMGIPRPPSNPYLMAPPAINRNAEPAPSSSLDQNLGMLENLSANDLQSLLDKMAPSRR